MFTRNPAHYRDIINQILNESSIPIPNKQELNLARFTRLARQKNIPAWIKNNLIFDDNGLDINVREYICTIFPIKSNFIESVYMLVLVYQDHVECSNKLHVVFNESEFTSPKDKVARHIKITGGWGENHIREELSKILNFDVGYIDFYESEDDSYALFDAQNLADNINVYLTPFVSLFFNQPDDIQNWQNSLK